MTGRTIHFHLSISISIDTDGGVKSAVVAPIEAKSAETTEFSKGQSDEMAWQGMDAVLGSVKSMAALARALGITRGAVAQWDRVPAERIGEVSKVTGLPQNVIRPDLFPSGGAA